MVNAAWQTWVRVMTEQADISVENQTLAKLDRVNPTPAPLDAQLSTSQSNSSQPNSPTMAIEQNPARVPSIDDLQRQNHDLLEWIAQLEASLGECQQALQMQMERSQAQDQLLAQRGQDLAETQDQMTRLFQELESSHQTSQRQQVLVETLTQKLATSQAQIAQLERDCTLAQQRYDEQAQHLAQAESISHDLRARLYRQQRYTLQFKAALEKCLERSHRHDQANSEVANLQGLTPTDSLSIETMLDDLAEPSQSGYPKAKPVQPWTAELDPSESEMFSESVPGTPTFADANDSSFSAIVQPSEVLTDLSTDLSTTLPELAPACIIEPLEPVEQTEFALDSTTNDPWSLLDANTLEWTTATSDVGPEVSDDIKKLLDEMLQSASELLGPELPELTTPDVTAIPAELLSPIATATPPVPPELPLAGNPTSPLTQPHGVEETLEAVPAAATHLPLDELQSHELQILIPEAMEATTVSSPAVAAPASPLADSSIADVIPLPTAATTAVDRSPVPSSPVIPFPGVHAQPLTAAIAEPTEPTSPTPSTSGFNQPSVLSILSNVSSPSHQEAVSATAAQPLPLPERSPFPEPPPEPTSPKVNPSSNSWRELLTLKTQLLANTSFGSTFSPELVTAATSATDTSMNPASDSQLDPQLVGATSTPSTEGKSPSPSPLLYPSRSGKKITSLAAIDLPTFPRKP